MNEAVCQLEPNSVWTFFEKLNAVPRASKKEAQVIKFMKEFGESLRLETIVDPTGNVIIRKPATPGMEDRKGIILQAHLDMVHQKNADTEFDFDSQGIQSVIDGEWVKANGTTLGADNGMGVASIMAVLAADDLEHGPIEGLFTIDEETGMTGAFHLKPGVLKGTILLNTDTEEEGELCIGCAGGIDTNILFKYSEETPKRAKAFRLSVTGLRGGHSGCEIHVGRGNSNKIMNRMIWESQTCDIRIASIDGGSLRNAIPRESFALVTVDAAKANDFKKLVEELANDIRAELKRTEPDLMIKLESAELPEKVMKSDDQMKLVRAIYAAPCGVVRMSDEMPGLVETSTSLARVAIESGQAVVLFLSRSSVETAKDDICNALESTFRLVGAQVEHANSYPGWKPNADSEILAQMKTIYQDLFGTDPEVNAVHAGLECGIINGAYPGLDMISFGPTIRNPHSPDEKCEIASVAKYWKYLVTVLKNAPKN